MLSSRFYRKFIFFLAIAIFGLAIACGSDAAPEPAAGDATPVPVASDTDADSHADEADHAGEEATALAEHETDEHAAGDDDEHAAEESGAQEHAHGEAVVDPDAPMVHVFATEFAYEIPEVKVEAGHPFTIMLHNEGALEHDITIEGFEETGGIHLLPKEDGMATFELLEPGEYKVYCTVPGHRPAGMEAILVVEGDDHADGEDHGA